MLYITGSCQKDPWLFFFSKLFKTEISFKTEKNNFFLLKLVHMSLRLQQGLRLPQIILSTVSCTSHVQFHHVLLELEPFDFPEFKNAWWHWFNGAIELNKSEELLFRKTFLLNQFLYHFVHERPVLLENLV